MEVPIRQVPPDQYQVSNYGQIMQNVVDATTGVRLRPGSLELVDIGEGARVNGLYDWEAQDVVVAVSNQKTFKLSDSATGFFSYLLLEGGTDKLVFEGGSGNLMLEASASSTDVTGDNLDANNPVIFADYGDYLYMANGGQVLELHPSQDQVTHGGNDYTCIKNNIDVEPGVTSGWATYWQDDGAGSSHSAWASGTRYGSGNADALEDASWPTTVKWIAILDSYLLMLDTDTQTIYQSTVEKPWEYNAFFTADQTPDDANCMRVFGGDLWIGGRQSLQIFLNDGVNVNLIPSNYGAITSGVVAPYSFLEVRGGFVYIDDQRRLVRLNGRDPQPISESLNSFIKSVPTITDAVGQEIVIDGITYYILSFPTSEKTCAVNLENGTWTEWFFTDANSNLREWQGFSIVYVPRWDEIVAGDDGGGVNKIATTYEDDDGTAITGKIRSARMQTFNRVAVSRLNIALTKIADVTPATSSFTVKWRDDDQDWGAEHTLTISDNSDTDVQKQIRRLGSYRHNRQYEFDVTNLHPYAIQRVDQI